MPSGEYSISLRTIIEESLKSREAWISLSTFAQQVMRAKEAAERERERQGQGASRMDEGYSGDECDPP